MDEKHNNLPVDKISFCYGSEEEAITLDKIKIGEKFRFMDETTFDIKCDTCEIDNIFSVYRIVNKLIIRFDPVL